ncbi:M56 family metallopeptidase [Aeoliella sp. SH292]|uniref:M56 family metallopeptidase n=1 Tax=Aeoliella sp. SH292 TaxID=3454464 RepID=UPI003F9CACDF
MNMATIVSCIVQVTLFAAAAGVVYLVARRLHASLGSITAALSLALVLVLTVLAASPWPRWDFSARTANMQAEVRAVPISPMEIADVDDGAAPIVNAVEAPPLESPLAAAWSAFATAIAEPSPEVAPAETTPAAFSWRTAVRWLLMACIGVGLVRFVWGVWVVRSLVGSSKPLGDDDHAAAELLDILQAKLSLTRIVSLRESTTIATPATVGWRRPTILLPASWRDWTPDELEAALAHELAHIAARDYRSWLVARLAVAVHFYHPLVHWLARRLQLEQELAADAMAAQVIGDRQTYLRSLASLALATPHHRLAGPAQTLIPGRSLLMRRVEMLRESRRSTASATSRPAARLATMFAVALLAVGVAGVRQVASGQSGPGAAVAESSEQQLEKVPRIGLEVVPDNSLAVVSIRPAEVFTQPAYRELATKINDVMPPFFKQRGITIAQISEVLIVFYGQNNAPPRFVLRFTQPKACEAYIAGTVEEMKSSSGFNASNPPLTWATDDQRLTKIDERTAVLDQIVRQGSSPQSFPPVLKPERGWEAAWNAAADSQVTAALDVETLYRVVLRDEPDEMMNMPLTMFAPVIKGTNWCVASVNMKESLSINAIAECKDEASAKSVAATSQAAKVLLGNLAEQQRAAAKQQMLPGMAAYQGTIDSLFDLVAEFSADAQIVAEGDEVKLGFTSKKMDADKVAIATGLLMPAVEAAREAARRSQSMNNMKQILLAMHMYYSAYNHFPPAVIYETLPDGKKVARSWRVELLPYFGDEALYQQYRKDEPWDSEANKQVLAKIPAIYRAPSDDLTSTDAGYFVLTGPTTAFSTEGEGTRMEDITDGTSNTIALVDAKRDIPWTNPEDIAYDAAKPLPEFGGRHPGIFLAGFTDGSVQAIANEIDQQMLRWMIEKADGNPINRAEQGIPAAEATAELVPEEYREPTPQIIPSPQ